MTERYDAQGRLVVDLDELKAAMRRGGPPTPDDVTILRDGNRLNTPEAIMAVVEELRAQRARRQAAVATARQQLRRRRTNALAGSLALQRRVVRDVQHGR